MTYQTDQLKFTVVRILYLMSHLLVPISNERIHVMLCKFTARSSSAIKTKGLG